MQNKPTKKAPSLQVNDAAKVKPTKAANTPTVTSNEDFHYFMMQDNVPIAAMNIETALDLSNAIYYFFPDNCKHELQANQNLLFGLLKDAIGNRELEDNYKASLYVELCSNISQLLNVCLQIQTDTRNIIQ